MPFNIFGEHITPDEPNKLQSNKPIKVRAEKRRGKFLTVIYNLPLDKKQLQSLASSLKKELGTGGTVKEDKIELQGSIVEDVHKALNNHGFKNS